MSDSQSVNTAVNLSSLTSTSGVSSSTAASLADGTYTVTLSYQDYLGNPVSTDVASSVTIDTTAPVISKLEHSVMRPAGLSVRWVTNEPATTRVLYSKTAPGSLTDTTTDMTLTTVHVSNTLGLDELVEYSFYVTSTDAAGNSSISDNIVLNTAHQGG